MHVALNLVFLVPVLEALDLGVPVASSDLPVLREVGGELPLFFDPNDPEGAARVIEAALAVSRPLPGARERAAEFTWEAAAAGTWQAYERALAG